MEKVKWLITMGGYDTCDATIEETSCSILIQLPKNKTPEEWFLNNFEVLGNRLTFYPTSLQQYIKIKW